MPKSPTPPVVLSDDELEHLFNLTHRGVCKARVFTRARVLQKLHEGVGRPEICRSLGVCLPTITKAHQKFAEGGLEAALGELPRPGKAPKLDAKQAAQITAIACSRAPDGHEHWTLRMLAGQVVQLGFADSFSHEAMRQLLKKTSSSHGRSRSGASRKSTRSS